MKDIAEELGVSIVTVSKALRNHPDIAKGTRERILKRVKDLNYRPNLMARSLVTGRSSLIGFVVPDLIHPFFAEIAKSLSAALRKRGFFLIVASSEGDPELEQAEIDHMLAHRLGTLVVATCQPDASHLKQVRDGGTPLILLDRCFKGFSSNFVGADDYAAGVMATEHLLAAGRKRIAHIRGPENNVGEARAAGYRDTLAKHGVRLVEEYMVRPKGGLDSDGQAMGKGAMEALLKLKPRPDAVFCFNDTIAIGALVGAFEAGVRVPRDMAVIGCGNYHYANALRVPLSSIDQKVEEIGGHAAKMIFSLIEAKDEVTRAKRAILRPTLVERSSTKPLA
jgi:LacI family transcriptional regulator